MSVNIIIGPMWSGKTTEVLRLGRRYEISGKKVLYIKHSIDNRYCENNDSYIVSHDQKKHSSISVGSLKEVSPNQLKNVSVICIDEGHFFEDIVKQTEIWCSRGKIIIISALNGDFERQPFPNISKLLARADMIKHLTSICTKCGNEAPFTKRITNCSDKVLVGADMDYTVMCRKCYSNQ